MPPGDSRPLRYPPGCNRIESPCVQLFLMLRFSTAAATVLALFHCCAVGAEVQPETISAVSIVGTSAVIPLETQVGQKLDPVKLQKDVKTLWRSGQFSDIQAEATQDGEDVRVVFRGQAKHFMLLRRVQVTPPTPGVDLKLAPDSNIDPLGASQIADAVRKKLEGSGFPFAKVDASLLPAGGNHVDLAIRIDQGKKLDITQAKITGELGARPRDARDARKALKWTTAKTMLPGIPGIWKGWRVLPGYSDNAVRSDLGNLQSFYYTRGYFDAEVTANPVDTTTSLAAVQFNVRAGPRYAIRQILFPDHVGDNPIRPEADAGFPARAVCKRLLDERRKAEQVGILDFAARIEIRELPGASFTSGPEMRKWADVTAAIERGPAYRVGRIEFHGNRGIGDLTMRRSLLVREAEPLDETLLRKSLARLNSTGLFETLSESNVVINTPSGSDRADITIQVHEQKPRHWYLSGPVGPMSLGGSLQLAIGSRLPSWGQGLFELATYTVAAHLILLPKPLGSILPGLPNRRLLPMFTVGRAWLPGERFLSGFVVAPQLGWRGMLAGYGVSQARGFLGGLFESERSYQPVLPVTVTHQAANGSVDGHEGTLYCKPIMTATDRMGQVGGMATRLLFSFSPF